MEDRPILIVDSLNVFMRHFTANPSMASTGEHCGGFIGFLGGLGNLCEMFSPSRLVVVWESGGSLRKKDTKSDYKNGRRPPKLNRYYEDDIPPTAENHTMQVSLLVKALNHLPVTQVYVRDCEADDVIGYLGRYSFGASRIILASSDRDLYQLIDNRVQQWSPGQKKLIDRAEVVKKFGISAENICTARVFVGDPSDNIQGVKGAGFKNLARWFPELASDKFISHRDIVAAAQNLRAAGNKGQVINRIADFGPQADVSWKLMYLSTSRLAGDQIQKINGQLENQGKSDKMALMRLLVQFGMQKFDINRHFRAINSVGR